MPSLAALHTFPWLPLPSRRFTSLAHFHRLKFDLTERTLQDGVGNRKFNDSFVLRKSSVVHMTLHKINATCPGVTWTTSRDLVMLHYVLFEAVHTSISSSDRFSYFQGHCNYSVPLVLLNGQLVFSNCRSMVLSCTSYPFNEE